MTGTSSSAIRGQSWRHAWIKAMHVPVSYNVERVSPPSILHFTLQMGRLLASDNLLCFFLYERIIKAKMWRVEFLKISIKEAKERSQLRWR